MLYQPTTTTINIKNYIPVILLLVFNQLHFRSKVYF